MGLFPFIDDALLVNKANKHVLESLEVRTSRIRAFLTRFKSSLEYDIVPITDVYGPTAWDPNIQALVVSKETISGGDASTYLSTALKSHPHPASPQRRPYELCYDE